MSSEHCPFVNRSEAACEKHLRLGDMAWAMDHCFADYESCPTHVALALNPSKVAESLVAELLQLTVSGVPVTRLGTPQPISASRSRRRPKTVIYVAGQTTFRYRLKRVLIDLTIGQLPASWRRAG